MRHSNKAGNLVKDINRLMKVKYELNEIMEISDRLCNADALCDGSCHLVLEKLSEYYDISEYANIVKTILSIFFSANSRFVSVISIKNRAVRKGQPRSCGKIY